jgi:hypothetical protein
VGPDDYPDDRYFRFELVGVDGLQLASMYNRCGGDHFIAFEAVRSIVPSRACSSHAGGRNETGSPRCTGLSTWSPSRWHHAT